MKTPNYRKLLTQLIDRVDDYLDKYCHEQCMVADKDTCNECYVRQAQEIVDLTQSEINYESP